MIQQLRFFERAVWVAALVLAVSSWRLTSPQTAWACTVVAFTTSLNFSLARLILSRLIVLSGRARLVCGLLYVAKFVTWVGLLAWMIIHLHWPAVALFVGLMPLPLALNALLVRELLWVRQCRTVGPG